MLAGVSSPKNVLGNFLYVVSRIFVPKKEMCESTTDCDIVKESHSSSEPCSQPAASCHACTVVGRFISTVGFGNHCIVIHHAIFVMHIAM